MRLSSIPPHARIGCGSRYWEPSLTHSHKPYDRSVRMLRMSLNLHPAAPVAAPVAAPRAFAPRRLACADARADPRTMGLWDEFSTIAARTSLCRPQNDRALPHRLTCT